MEEQNNLILNEQATDALRESGKWCTFLSILGFIGIGLMLVISIFIGTLMGAMPDQPGMGEMSPFHAMKDYLALFYVIIAIIYFFPIYYLYKYAVGIKNAINVRSSEMVSEALVYLKSHHKFLGIMAIVMISLYFLILIGAVIFAASMSSGNM